MPIARDVVAMIEVEIKARASTDALADVLKRRGAEFEKTVVQSDTYYNAPHRDFAETDEAVRIREQDGRAYLTYKGKKIDAQSKTRKEVEVAVENKARMEDILLSLGFRKTLDVIKTRSIYHYGGVEICLDRIEGLGEFVELESMAENASEIPQKRDGLIALMRELGVEGGQIRESYLEMLMAKKFFI
ncbi:MAG: CYTH domain protein [Methanocella sp. PtaU1.Bin125]|nr:MAG: CYTH domain protein [Methanocella sp. PtaU1.Bin125]